MVSSPRTADALASMRRLTQQILLLLGACAHAGVRNVLQTWGSAESGQTAHGTLADSVKAYFYMYHGKGVLLMVGYHSLSAAVEAARAAASLL